MSWSNFFITWISFAILLFWWDAERQKKKIVNLLDRFLAIRRDPDPAETRSLIFQMEKWTDAQQSQKWD